MHNDETITVQRGVVAVDGREFLRFDTNIAAAEFLVFKCKKQYYGTARPVAGPDTFIFGEREP